MKVEAVETMIHVDGDEWSASVRGWAVAVNGRILRDEETGEPLYCSQNRRDVERMVKSLKRNPRMLSSND